MGLERVTFRVHYWGKFDRKYNCIYTGEKIELVNDNYELGRLSFIELETMLNPFGYQQGDMIYYLQPDKSLDDGLVLLMSNDSVVGMAEYLQRCKYDIPIVALYIVSYHASDEQVSACEVDEGADDAQTMKIINDPFWNSLMGNEGDGDDQPVACSITHDNEALDDGGDEMDDDKDVEDVVGDGDEDVEDVVYDEGQRDDDDEVNESTTHTLSAADQLLDDEEDDTSSSKLMRSDLLVTLSYSDDDDNEVVSKPRCVLTFAKFYDIDMADPELQVGICFGETIQRSCEDIQPREWERRTIHKKTIRIE